jgi:hypothetical protein
MAGGSKPRPGSKASATSQDGARKGGGINTAKHAGPARKNKSKTRPTGARGAQLQKRQRP